MNNIACAVLAFKRPKYLRRVIDSLAKNTRAAEVDWYFFVDGAVTKNGIKRADFNKIRQVINKIHDFPKSYMINISETNDGIAKQKQKAHQLFDSYEQVIFFEDDMIVSPFYISLLINMQKAFPNDLVAAPATATKNIEEKASVKHIRDIRQHFWGYSLKAHTFQKIKSKFDAYCEDVGDDYKRRPHKLLKEKHNLRVSSHDGALGAAMKEQNIRRINTMLPRAQYIGREDGTNFKTSAYDSAGFGKTRQITFPEDEYNKAFIWW